MSPDDKTQADNIAVLIDQCKPEGVDVISLVKKYNRIFLGYPLLKRGANEVKDIDIGKIYNIIDDPSELKEDDLEQDIKQRKCKDKYELPYEDASKRPNNYSDEDYLNYCKKAKNIVKIIHKVIGLLKSDHPHKVYALIYRPPFSYVGIIDGWDFPKGEDQERVKMLNDYLKLCNNKANKTSNGDQNRQEQENVLKDLEACNKKTKTSTASHVAHMALTFKLRDLKLITPLLPIPEIMLRSQAKLSEPTAKDKQIIKKKEIIEWVDIVYEKAKNREKLDLRSLYKELSSGYKNGKFPILKYLLTPTRLETLSIDLLNLENKDQTWFHSGGMGDMGVDGFGIDNDGNVVGLLQCKKELKNPEKLKKDIKERLNALIDNQNEEHKEITLYIATLSDLSHSKEIFEGDLIEGIARYKILDYERIECLVGKHKKELGQALRWISDVVPDNNSEDCLKPKAEVPFPLPRSQSASEPVI